MTVWMIWNFFFFLIQGISGFAKTNPCFGWLELLKRPAANKKRNRTQDLISDENTPNRSVGLNYLDLSSDFQYIILTFSRGFESSNNPFKLKWSTSGNHMNNLNRMNFPISFPFTNFAVFREISVLGHFFRCEDWGIVQHLRKVKILSREGEQE